MGAHSGIFNNPALPSLSMFLEESRGRCKDQEVGTFGGLPEKNADRRIYYNPVAESAGSSAKTFGPLFKFSRFGPSEKAYVLSRLRDYQSTGGSQSEFCSGIGISQGRIERWGASYRRFGEAGLCAHSTRPEPCGHLLHDDRATSDPRAPRPRFDYELIRIKSGRLDHATGT